jgi:hypothetical protein
MFSIKPAKRKAAKRKGEVKQFTRGRRVSASAAEQHAQWKRAEAEAKAARKKSGGR